MSSTNKTTNYELTQFLATDVPSWLVDYNGDMVKIDTQMKVNATAAANAQDKADDADSKADINASNINALEAALNTPNTGLAARISNIENNINTLQELMGNGTPTTTDHTVIGAINELNSGLNEIKNTIGDDTLDTAAQTLTGAINEVNDKIDNLTGYVLLAERAIQVDTFDSSDTVENNFTKARTKMTQTLQNLPSGHKGEIVSLITNGNGTHYSPIEHKLEDNSISGYLNTFVKQAVYSDVGSFTYIELDASPSARDLVINPIGPVIAINNWNNFPSGTTGIRFLFREYAPI